MGTCMPGQAASKTLVPTLPNKTFDWRFAKR